MKVETPNISSGNSFNNIFSLGGYDLGEMTRYHT